ncbi:protein of unknown function [[Clostridium] ultunense Esp]|uniref:Uncharacterized protein n=1 Tax=[Clostridium] ultunense Esp TaxID=1288971 RepID=A0A1M4PSX4_9FIRM|nr:protein of unknown function [[Clostridium] ultunense Esp]SHD78585.1 protein of unknown function [[Clostridium] ultunense Esp]
MGFFTSFRKVIRPSILAASDVYFENGQKCLQNSYNLPFIYCRIYCILNIIRNNNTEEKGVVFYG